ncbi:MAG: DNA repair exonuclease [Clostridia bacterium]|nr:DNA repair exonuclease [Clostridia bacterium]
MQKFIHCADIHLGSKMESKLTKEKAEERRTEVRNTFHRMVQYAKAEGVRAILLSGDVFDSDRPLKRDKVFFYDVVKGNPEIDFLYLRGNHDGKESYTEEGLSNLKTFSSEWTGYDYDGVHICGLEIVRENAQSFYSTLKLDKDRKNIVMLHGQVESSTGVDKVHVGKLADKNIDYLALGHIHSYSENKLDDRGRYAFSGCLEGRGFDELGSKGFVLLEVDDVVKSTFVPFAQRTIHEFMVDVTDSKNNYEAYQAVKKQVKINAADLYRIQLIGEIAYEDETLEGDVENLLNLECYFASVKNHTARKIDPAAYEGDASLRGEFVRTVLAKTDIDDARKREIITLGLKVLAGQGVEV